MKIETYIDKLNEFVTVHYFPFEKKVVLMGFCKENMARIKAPNVIGMWKIKQLKIK